MVLGSPGIHRSFVFENENWCVQYLLSTAVVLLRRQQIRGLHVG